MTAVARLLRQLVWLLALTMMAPSVAAATSAATSSPELPEGFGELARSRSTFLDVYFGGHKVAETFAVTRPGILRFQSPAEILSQLPDIIKAPEVAATLSGELPTHGEAVCSQSNKDNCGVINPEVLGIILDEDHFRVDIFVSSRFLQTSRQHAVGYLPTPSASLSLTNAIALNASGTIGGASIYNLQNRTIVGLHNARIRANTSVATKAGLIVDDLVGEVDRKNLRYSAGLFWAPGSDFLGRRRIVGAGVGTQLDTWSDRGQLQGTPLIVFLSQPARVEIIVDDRLVSSRSYPAGNIELDTSEMSEGSYSVLLRIRPSNGPVHEERRFFVKSTQVPPAGHPTFYAYAGVLANTRYRQPISPSKTIYYQAGTAWRLANSFALDVAALGTQDKAIVQGGAWFIRGPARIRVAGLVSTAGDRGALVQGSTGGHGPLSINFDLRRIWSRDGRPLIPLSGTSNSFDGDPQSGIQLASGSYTQATASVGLQLGSAYLSVVGSYRKDRHFSADYAIGPSIHWPIIVRNRLQVSFDASAQRTRSSMAAFGGVRVQFNSGSLSLLSTAGAAYQSDQGDRKSSVSRAVSGFTAQYSYQGTDTQLNVGAGLDRNIGSSLGHATGTFEGRFANVRADVVRDFETHTGTQYDIGFQSGLALGADGMAFGARDLQQSALVVSIDGDASDAAFKVLVNDVPKGQARIGRRLVVFVPPYRKYNIRLIPVGAVPVDYDTAAREITLYPGNVQSLRWRAQSYFTVFAQAVSRTGAPISDALVQTPKSIAETDGDGYFKLDVRRNDVITIAQRDGPSCHITLGRVAVRNDLASLGKVVCE